MIEISCPNCQHVLAVFDEQEIAANRAIRRSYERMFTNPVLCGACKVWVQVPTPSTVSPAQEA